MQKLDNFITATYSLGDGFLVDIVSENGKYFEAYLYNRLCGIKELMFGSISTEKEFVSLVEANAPDCIDDYRIEYMEEDI